MEVKYVICLVTRVAWYTAINYQVTCILYTKFTIIGVFQGLAITLVSDEGDAKILNEVQDRFDVNITELPDEIDLSSYSKLIGMDIPFYTLLYLRSSYVLEGSSLVGIHYTCSQLHMYVQGSLIHFQTAILELDWPQHDHPTASVIAQQYSSVTLVSWPFHSRKEKFGIHFRTVSVSINFYFFF